MCELKQTVPFFLHYFMHLFYSGAAIHGTMLSIENVAHNSFISLCLAVSLSLRSGFPFAGFFVFFSHSKLLLSYFSWQKSFKITLVNGSKWASNHWGIYCIWCALRWTQLTACKQNVAESDHVPNCKWYSELDGSLCLGFHMILHLCENHFGKFTRICCWYCTIIGAIYALYMIL